MNTLVKVAYEGETVDADQMEFQSSAPCSEILTIEGGVVIELSHKVASIFRLRDKKKEDGTPIYLCMGNVTLKTTIPNTGQSSVGG